MRIHRPGILAVSVAALACVALDAGPARAFPPHVFVATGDGFTPGNCAAVDLEAPWGSATGLEPVGARPALRHFLGLHWVVDRSPGGAVQVIDPATFDTVASFAVGATPWDVLVVDASHAWVTRMDSAWLLEIDPATGAPLDSLDLGLFADTDGIPEMAMMARDGNRLFVQIQRINFVDQPPFLPGLVAVVDLDTRTIVDTDPVAPGTQAIELVGLWPDHRMEIDAAARRLYVSTPGPRLDISGGIEEIDLDTLTRVGFLISEATVSVDVGGFVLVSPTKGYIVGHTDIVPSSHLIPFSRPDGTPMFEIFTGILFALDNVAYDAATGQVFFPHPPENGIEVFDAATDAHLNTMPVPTGDGPLDLLVARGGAVAAPTPVPAAGALSRAVPNPARGATEIRLGRRTARIRATILDVRGRVVRTLPGPVLRWDGRDAAGGSAPAGVYFYRLEGDLVHSGSITLLR